MNGGVGKNRCVINLHSIVRGAITSVNPDILAQYYASTGNTVGADGTQSPAYATAVPVYVQVQPLSKSELRLVERLNLQGVFRNLYAYSNPQGIVRTFGQGGDIFVFPPFGTQPSQNWKVVDVAGPWNVNDQGWTKLLICLQADTPL